MIIDQLRKSLLQIAVQGKLVPQDHNDEPASELLAKIRKERAKLIQQGKIKKPKAESRIFRRNGSWWEQIGKEEKCIDEEIPFAIPDSWEWVRLGEIVFNHGQTIPSTTFCYIDIGSIDNKKLKLNEHETWISAEEAPSRARKVVKFGDILYSTVRPYLHNICIVDREFSYPPIASTGFAVLACGENIVNSFLFYFLISPDFDAYANHSDNSKGVAYPAINDTRFYRALIPLPPLAEQERIVARLDDILSHIYAHKRTASELAQLGSACKKSILQHAIQGKLVPQDSNDEPASELLAKIRKERAKLIQQGKINKPKNESRIFRRDGSWWEQTGKEEKCIDEEIPFEIPDSWEWVRLGTLGIFIRGSGLKRSDIKPDGAPCVRYGELYTTYDISFNKTGSYVDKEIAKDLKEIVHGDLLFTLTGENKEEIGKAVAWLGNEAAYAGGDLGILKWHGQYPLFLSYLLNSPYAIAKKAALGTGNIIVHISCDKLASLLLPLPPLAEQKRIAAKVAEFMEIERRLGAALSD